MGASGDDTERSEATTDPGVDSKWVLRGVLPEDDTYLTLTGQKLVIGRDEDVEVRLTNTRVSRRHAELYRQGPIYALRDLGSTNGSYVDGQRIEHCAIRPGMLLRIGDWLGLVEKSNAKSFAPFRELASGIFGGGCLAEALKTVAHAAKSTLPLELVGETGTGKELFARAFHAFSEREGAFHAVNCAALPEALAEGELFGYRRGAFTGAERGHIGQLRAAHQGTLFLDEISDLRPELQAKLLRVLEQKEVVPLGETRAIALDTRVVVATQKPLSALVATGAFRADLAMRLSGVTVEVAPLRSRRADIPRLFGEFLSRHTPRGRPSVGTKLYERLCLHAWPGNVRELEILAQNLLARFPEASELGQRHLPLHLRAAGEPAKPDQPREAETRSAHDLRRLTSALERSGGNLKLAAEMAGISRQRAYRLITPRRSS
jgi:transcriptional regulator with GAF, ATPase, and Fis domain